MSNLDYPQAAQEIARAKELYALLTFPDDQLLLVRAYWLFNPAIIHYELIAAVTDQRQAYNAAYDAFPFDDLPRPDDELHYGMTLLTLRFRHGTTCIVLTTAQLRQLTQTRDVLLKS